MNTALVTGGAGFIGSHVVDCLLSYGWSVDVIDNLSTGKQSNLDKSARLHTWDISHKSTSSRILHLGPDAIFHLAAQTDVPTSVAEPAKDQRTNALGTLRVLQGAWTVGAKLIYASTGGAIYGECIDPATERFMPRPKSPYAVSKLAGEHYLLAYNELYGMENVVLRYANVYGPRQSANVDGGVVAIFKDVLSMDKIPTIYGDGNQTRDFIHVDDVTTATVSAANLSGGIYNVGTGVETTINDLAEMLGAEACDYQPVRRGDLFRSVLDPTKLQTNLIGWKPRPINEALLQ